MAESNSLMLVLTTEGDAMRAKALARSLLERGLVACVSLQSTEALYYWEGEIQMDGEVQLLMKTTADRLERLQQVLGELHSYDTPGMVVLAGDVFAGLWTLGDGGSQLRWVLTRS
jgi:periplasmic divalent cation tolerance protein